MFNPITERLYAKKILNINITYTYVNTYIIYCVYGCYLSIYNNDCKLKQEYREQLFLHE